MKNPILRRILVWVVLVWSFVVIGIGFFLLSKVENGIFPILLITYGLFEFVQTVRELKRKS